MDKLVKGIIIGGAIGSVVGIGLSPKKENKKKVSKTVPEKTSSRASTPPVSSKKKGLFSTLGRGVKILITGKK